MVTEDRGFYCGGGVNASLDLAMQEISDDHSFLPPRGTPLVSAAS